MKLQITVIGDEILLGHVTDTNSGFIARTLEPLGFAVTDIHAVADNADAIKESIRRSLDVADLVIVTGGLGPTKDDITKRTLLEIFGGEMVFDESVYANVKKIFAGRHLEMNELTRLQAMVPSSCRVLANAYGTAPGMWFETPDGKVLISLPGVPHETCSMMQGNVLDRIKQRFIPDMHFSHRKIRVGGITESGLAEMLSDWEDALPAQLHLAYLPASPVITLRLDCSGKDAGATEQILDRYTAELKAKVQPYLIDEGDKSIAETMLERLRSLQLTLCTAESCTGGRIAASITAVAGCSDVFLGGVVSYANSVKRGILGVEQDTLERYGAVSPQTVEQMLRGAMHATGADCAIATSGIAGPGGATPGKPVGTVWIGAAIPGHKPVMELHHMSGSRGQVIERSVTTAMIMLIKLLEQSRQQPEI